MNWCEQPRIDKYVHRDNDHTKRLSLLQCGCGLFSTDSVIVTPARARATESRSVCVYWQLLIKTDIQRRYVFIISDVPMAVLRPQPFALWGYVVW